MFKPTQALFSKASRLPLNSKKGNKDFYKGTRTGNIMMRKRIATSDRTGKQLYDKNGREMSWTKMTNRIDESRVPSYIVPPGLAETPLRPYVFMGEALEGGVPKRPDPGMPSYPRMGKEGFNGVYYRTIVEEMLAKRAVKDEQIKDGLLIDDKSKR
ncbi:hypothetical protein IE53DRAFT_388726 [Violaceomyces palustris]|uniref:Uncharacterized protein n=1 Tax=Violaceomyces palustris TaxID=1673888 RepID=A0ACD0NTA1_9BASI|nr:hypothetical protein IE53DRAFT_388726 [Violaceomyces palustris]